MATSSWSFPSRWWQRSVSRLADSVDVLDDTAVKTLIFVALGWPLARRAGEGKEMALVILGPAVVAGREAVQRYVDPSAPDVLPVVLVSLGAWRSTGRAHGCSLGRVTAAGR